MLILGGLKLLVLELGLLGESHREIESSTAARRQTKQFNEFISRIEIQLLLNSGE